MLSGYLNSNDKWKTKRDLVFPLTRHKYAQGMMTRKSDADRNTKTVLV